MNTVLKEDLNTILNCAYIHWERYRNCTVLVTGATGLIGSMIVRTLDYANKEKELDIHILMLVRSLEKVDQVFGRDIDFTKIKVLVGDAREQIEICENIDFIIHAACITDSALMVRQPIATFLTSVEGTKNILELAVKHSELKGLLYLSSMEMYGVTAKEDNPVTEDKLGYLDLTNVRSSYQEGKRAAEFLCTAYHAEHNLPIKIARLAQTFGAGVPKTSQKVYAQFARSALENKDIILHTSGESTGNYCYTADVIKALFCILEKGEAGQAYNVVNENNTMTIREMAELVAGELTDHRIKIVYDIPDSPLTYGYAPKVMMHLSGRKLKELGWTPDVDLIDMYRRMILHWNC